MLAEIVSGHADLAEVFWLIAVVLFVVGLVLHLTTVTYGQAVGVCLYGGLALGFAGFLVR